MAGVDRAAESALPRAVARSVVLKETPRCAECQLAPRWCICAGRRTVDLPLGVDVLMHFMESYRPSSTGHLIRRVVPAARLHLHGRGPAPTAADLAGPGEELWILHPQGEPLPAAAPARLRVLLLDGTWTQAAGMARATAPWGRRVGLPLTGESRYWLRTQAGPGRLSTIEALLFLLGALGHAEAEARLRVQFELHVYATLLARGFKARAAAYLEHSPVRAALPEMVARLAAGPRLSP